MPTIRITKVFRFEAAHALKGYDGPCRNIHGHSYELSVTLEGVPVSDPGSPGVGMILDFSELKRIVKKNIIDPFDHALILPKDYTVCLPTNEQEPFGKVIMVPYQPTSENLLVDFSTRIKPLLPSGISLYSMRLRETETSWAEWFSHEPDRPQE